MSTRGFRSVCVCIVLGLLAAGSPGADEATHVPRRTSSVITAPMVTAAPTIDGKLDDAAWRTAQPLRDWAYNKGVRHATDAYLARDANYIYLAARCYEDQLDQLVTDFKGTLMWKNDCIEIYIVPEKNQKLWTHLIATADGRTSGSIWVLDEWREPVQGEPIQMICKTGREKDAWTMELAIPISAFKLPIGRTKRWAWGVNRERHAVASEVSSFQGGFNKPEQYPNLVFDEWPIVFDGVGVKNRSDQTRTATVRLSSGDRSTNYKAKLNPGGTFTVDWASFIGPMEDDKPFTIDLLDDSGKPIASESYKLVPAPAKLAKIDPQKIPPAHFRKSVLDDPNFFPVAVWLQPAGAAAMYKEMGVNVFYGGVESYPNPRDKAWVDAIAAQGMYVILPLAQKHIDSELYKHPAVIGWHTQDEPDLAKTEYNGGPVPPAALMNQFLLSRGLDTQLPVFLNFGCGLGTDRFVGRAATYDMYDDYCRAADYVSYDIYPCNSLRADGPDRFCTIAKGLDRLVKWGDGKPVGFCFEANKFTKPGERDSRSPTAEEVKSQVWIALTHRAQYLMVFCHSWAGPKAKVSGIEPEMRAALKDILGEVHEMAPVLKAPFLPDAQCATVKNTMGSRVDCLTKKLDGATYLICANMYRQPEKPEITIPGVGNAKAEVLFENRTVEVRNGKLVDDFAPYGVHRYRIR